MYHHQSIDMSSHNDMNPAMTVRSLSFSDFLALNRASTRLNNSINACINEGNFPFQTIGDYLDASESGAYQLMRIPNFGRKTLEELDHLISAALDANEANTQVINTQDKCESASIRALTFLELLDQCHASVRLRNGITKGISEGLFPYGSVGEYIDGGKKATALLLSLPNIGKGAAKELQNFIENAIGKRHELADQLESAYPMVFDDLLDMYRHTPDTEPLTFHRIEKQIQQLLNLQRDAEVCKRRFQGDTLESIAIDLGVTRERVRQIAKKYDSIITNIYTEVWTKKAIAYLQSQQDAPNKLPSNDSISEYHRNFPAALRHVYLPESGRHGPLLSQERYQLATILGADTEAELKEAKQWSLERLLYEVKSFAVEIGRPQFMPMQKELVSHGRQDLRGAITRFGGQSKVAALAGLLYQGQQVAEDGSRTYWTEERIREFLHEVAEKEGHSGVMPTQTECRKYAPNPNTVVAIITRGGWYGKEKTWFEVANHYGLKYSKDIHRITLKFVRAFVESLGDALHCLTPSEVYVIFEQQGINKSGKNAHRDRTFDNFITAMQSGYLPREEVDRWVKGEKGELIEALFDPDIESIEDAFASVGRHLHKNDHRQKKDNPNDENYREDIEQHLPSPRAIDTLTSLEKATDVLVQTSSDAEAVQFLVAKAAGKLWRRCFDDEEAALDEARQHQGNVYSESARDSFLEEYTRSKQLPLPQGYSFRDADGVIRAPKLMQSLIAYKVLKDGRVLNLSGTGTGKTLSAILASRVIGAKLTVIACPNATIGGWSRTIMNAFPESDVCERTWFPVWSSTKKPRYLILNHELFQNRNEGHIKQFIEANMIDFVVVDELHQVKQRDEGFESQRRRLLNGIITDVPGNRPKPRVLGMSATPIINNLYEGKSLIELVSSLEHTEIGTVVNVQNCMKLYQKFTTMGFRMMPKYRTDRTPQIHPVDCTPYIQNLLELGTKPHPQQVESVLVRARWPIIKRYLEPKTVVFTDYVKDIVPYLVEMISQTGLSVGVYTGDEKLATEIGYSDMLDQFMRGELDVLLASIKTVGTGIDGLQFVCNNVIFATLPWTSTDYEQAVGRFDREGFKFNSLNIHIPKTYSVLGDGQEWSWCEAKLGRIENKRDIAKAAVDGEIPDTSSQLTPDKATSYWMGWLKRISEEGLSEIERRVIRVPLDETDQSETRRRIAAYGDFSHINSRWNTTHSSITHERLQNNPEEWCYYHTRLQEQERLWQHIPRNECIKHLTENLPQGSIVGDYGCGQAQLAHALRDIHTVYSLDHVAINHSVTACDMANSPLDHAILDAAVFSLSLMGSNLREYIADAYRTLKPGGQLLIYHPATGNDLHKFVQGLESFGFASVQHGTVYKWHFVWAIKRGRQKDTAAEIGF
jgi:SAM-dependent methyltransferase